MRDVEKVVNGFGEHKWYIKGTETLHREDGPAIIKPGHYQAWCQYGEYHRTDGPAIVYDDGRRFWWVHGFIVSSNEEFRLQANLTYEDLTMVVLKYGDVR